MNNVDWDIIGLEKLNNLLKKQNSIFYDKKHILFFTTTKKIINKMCEDFNNSENYEHIIA